MYSMAGFDCDPRNADRTIQTPPSLSLENGVKLKREPANEKVYASELQFASAIIVFRDVPAQKKKKKLVISANERKRTKKKKEENGNFMKFKVTTHHYTLISVSLEYFTVSALIQRSFVLNPSVSPGKQFN